MILNGDRLIAKKECVGFFDKGAIIKVIDVNENGMVSFVCGENFERKGLMNPVECEEYFERMAASEITAPTVTLEQIQAIIEASEFFVDTVFDKCTVVTCRLPNGFVITESSACVSPENYNEEMGANICIDKIIDKVWELEGYKLQDEVWRAKIEANLTCDECCNECEYNNTFLGTASDCEDCDECTVYDCPHNTRS